MGATILRWFWRDGVRYRAYYRSTADDAGRELVVASGSRSTAVPAPEGLTLDEIEEDRLYSLSEQLHLRDARMLWDTRIGR